MSCFFIWYAFIYLNRRNTAKQKAEEYAFGLFANVFAPWEDKMYPGQICARKAGKYDIYFNDDYNNELLLKDVEEKQLKHNPEKKTRTWFLQKIWFYPGDSKVPGGSFKIVKLGTGKRLNEYQCRRTDGKGPKGKKLVWFTIAYVMDRWHRTPGNGGNR